jgi:hypothetical protein
MLSNRLMNTLIRVLPLILVFGLLISLSFANVSQPYKTSIESREKALINPKQEKSNFAVSIIIPLVSALLGGLAGAGYAIQHAKKQAEKEYSAFILSFCSEMVTVFSRCVKYYRQFKSKEVSYSALFSFTDSSALSKFASVCEKPAVVAAIIELKSMYFQIQRHVEEASRFALDSSRSSTLEEKTELMKKAMHAQGTALAFFHSSYKDIIKEMDCLVIATKEVAPGTVANDLYSKYEIAKEDKVKIDDGITS